jgi:hypothetical protein
MNNDKYDTLLQLISEIGALYTYPDERAARWIAAAKEQKTLHEGCLELERRGLIYRDQERDGWILWKVKEP